MHIESCLIGYSNAEIIFYDLLGKKVLQKRLEINETNAIFNLSNFSEGMYTYQILADSNQVKKGKLAIVN